MAIHRARHLVSSLSGHPAPDPLTRLAIDLIGEFGTGHAAVPGAGPRHGVPPIPICVDSVGRHHRSSMVTGAPGSVSQQGVCALISTSVLTATAALAAVTGASAPQPGSEDPVTQPMRLSFASMPASAGSPTGRDLMAAGRALAATMTTGYPTVVADQAQTLPSSLLRADGTDIVTASRHPVAEPVIPTPPIQSAVAAPIPVIGHIPLPRVSPPSAARASIPSSAGTLALAAAMTQLGKPYRWGAAGPSAFDCSGLVLWAFNQAGISLPHSSSAQSAMGTAVTRDQLQPGDLVFFYSPVHHVGIYAGNGQVINAPTAGQPVKLSSLSTMPFHNARRL